MQTLLFLVLLLVNSNAAPAHPAAPSSAGAAIQTGIIQTLDTTEPNP